VASRLSVHLNQRISILLAALVVLLAVGGALLFIEPGGPSDDAQIQQLVQNFASAADHQDAKTIMTELCQAEAAGFADGDAASSTPVATPESHFLATSTSDIQITGDVASAKVTRSQNGPTAQSFSAALYFLKENGMWKVCDSAATQFNQHRKGLS
jgi:hypothetical protein